MYKKNKHYENIKIHDILAEKHDTLRMMLIVTVNIVVTPRHISVKSAFSLQDYTQPQFANNATATTIKT